MITLRKLIYMLAITTDSKGNPLFKNNPDGYRKFVREMRLAATGGGKAARTSGS